MLSKRVYCNAKYFTSCFNSSEQTRVLAGHTFLKEKTNRLPVFVCVAAKERFCPAIAPCPYDSNKCVLMNAITAVSKCVLHVDFAVYDLKWLNLINGEELTEIPLLSCRRVSQ